MTSAPVLTHPAAAMGPAHPAVDTAGGTAAAATPDVLHVTGARPNFPKAAPVIAALARRGVRQQLVHTGQHYDDRLSDIFFRELDLPRPDVELGVGSGSQAEQTAAVLVGMERLLTARRPRLLVVYGDVNSSLAAALAAAKLQVPVAHVEAGLRSFDAGMPEEVNRRLTDVLADLLFATSPEALAHLGAEGVPAGRMHLVGNPMIDTLLRHLGRLDPVAARREHGLPRRYAVATVHRPGNVDAPGDVAELVAVLHRAADLVDLVLPLHPRGRGALLAAGLADHPRVHVCEPLGYTGFLSLVQGAAVVLTDSGGVQEEATVLRVPCLTLRSTTERPVTVTSGSNRLVRRDQLDGALRSVLSGGGVSDRPDAVPPLWDGRAGERIASVIDRWLRERAGGAGAGPAAAGGRPVTDLLDTAGARELWDRRHRSEDGLRSGGHIGLTSEGNAIFYATRLGRLLDLLGDLDTRESPGLLLDAGCGKGWFARALAGCGWLVDGVDASPAAIEECRAAGGGPRYEAAELADLHRPVLYDAVLCIDVLFHVLADEEWRASLTRLASLVRLGGRLVVTDAVGAERRQLGAYIVHRPYAEYAAVLEPLGLRGPEVVPYRFRDSAIAFAAFTRAC